MRLIDADELINELASFRERQEDPKNKDIATTVSLFVEVYARTTTPIDISVVRCKDCRHRDPEDHKCDSGEMERQGCPFKVADDYFCAYGERRTDDVPKTD